MLNNTESLKYQANRGFATSLEHDEVTTDSVVEVSAETREQKERDDQHRVIQNKEPALKATVSGFQLVVATRYGTNASKI